MLIKTVTEKQLLKCMFDLMYGHSMSGVMEIINKRKKKKKEKRDNGREGRIIYIDLIDKAHFSFTSS